MSDFESDFESDFVDDSLGCGKIEVGTNNQAGALFRVSLPTIGVARQRAGRKPATAMPSA